MPNLLDKFYEIFYFFPLLFLGFAPPMYNTSIKLRAGGTQAPNSKYTGYATGCDHKTELGFCWKVLVKFLRINKDFWKIRPSNILYSNLFFFISFF